MNNKKILISGASIAGPTLAFWLHKYGFDVTIIERANSLRVGGQNIDVKGSARKITQLMGVEDAIKKANTGELGVQFVDENNKPKAILGQDGANSFTAELEILRGDLAGILYNATKENVAYIFGDSIAGVQEIETGVEVKFQSGKLQIFDLVICADGIRSNTRTIIFGDENVVKPLNLYISYFTIPKVASDTKWARWYNAPKERAILIRPDNEGTTRASLSFISPPMGYEKLAMAEQKEILIQKFADAGWEANRLLAELKKENTEVYMDSISQVKAPKWHIGRCAMTGDSAFCPSPLSGMGANSAIIGAYVLAGELSKHQNHLEAFASYENIMRPFIKKIQSLPPGVPYLAHPKGKLGLVLMHTILNIISSNFIKKVGQLFEGKIKSPYYDNTFALPDYGNE
jgi:2-polyprenyl-6-methoxyphenol hydroxylase-like FAD-dependent oxidoreductase